jgi:uncharacterized membrane protein (DUF106 family)
MEWSQLISTLGFPIVCCVALAIYVTKITQQNREDTKELNKQHTEEMLEFKEDIKEALNNNTIALNKLCEKLEKVGDK